MMQMRKKTIALGLATFTVWALGIVVANAQTARGVCGREKLRGFIDLYFTALESHNPSGLSLAPAVKYTENGRELKMGQGFWISAGKTLLKRSAIDSMRCSTHTQAVIEEEGRPIIYGVRLKLDNGKISEAETFVAREKEFSFNAKGLLDTKDQDWETLLLPEQRSSRLAMIAAANDYFELFDKKPTVNVPFASRCDRWENGTETTVRRTEISHSKIPEHDCSPKGLVTPRHKPRRFLVDVETGVVVAYVHFASTLPDFHMFKMRNGQVELIQAVIGANYKTMGWPDEPLYERSSN